MKQYDKTRKKSRRFLRRYINGTKGVISLFLAILMLPFVSVGGALLNAARVDSAIAIFDEALCNASNSTLGTYDSFLRTRFGLLAMSQDTSAHGSGYTAQDLISETFQFYMEQNAAALSNTYVETEIDAVGIYPLADTSVLLSEVLEYGKYAIPTKLVIDGLCINDIISNLTGDASLAENLIGTMSSGLSTVNQFGTCQDSFKDARDKLEAYAAARKQYEEAYSAFETAVNEYNVLIEEREQKISECNQEITDAEEDVSRAEDDLAGEDEDEDPAAYSQAQDDLESAENALKEAKGRLDAVIQEYQGKLDAQRAAVENSKAAYSGWIETFAGAVKEAETAVVNAQDAYLALEKAGTDLATSVSDTVCEFRTESMDSQIKGIEDSKRAASERGDTEAAERCSEQIAEAQGRKVNIETNHVILNAQADAVTTARETLSSFAKEGYEEKFNGICENLNKLKKKVEGYVIEGGYETPMPAAGAYYDNSTTEPLTKDTLMGMLRELAESIVGSAFLATVKALISFVQALAKLDVFFNPNLNAEIQKDLFPGGALPSEKDPGRLTSAYEAEDSRKSEYYKSLLNSYSSNGAMQGNGPDAGNLIDSIKEDIEKLAGCFEGNWDGSNIFSKLGELVSAAGSLVEHIVAFVKEAADLLMEAVGQKILLTGYVAYNIPNRTTYTGSALTGSSYELPSIGTANQGYAFYGAEAEYIMKGRLSETENQFLVFANIWLIRILYDVGFVITNKEVSALADSVGAATFGIGTVVVYILYIVAEPLVDTILLVNGGTVPIWKAKLYLTLSGIPDLVGEITGLPLLEEDVRQQLEDGANKVAASTEGESSGGTSAGAGSAGNNGAGSAGNNGTGSAGNNGTGSAGNNGAGSAGNNGAGSAGNNGIGSAGNNGAGSAGNSGAGSAGNNGAGSGGTAGASGSDGENTLGSAEDGLGGKIVDSLSFDYTKTILFAMLFENKEKMLNRLADVIQMEASYQAASGIGRYEFDLDQSYTYLRSSGSFQMNEFLPISDRTGIHSKERVIYRGY